MISEHSGVSDTPELSAGKDLGTLDSFCTVESRENSRGGCDGRCWVSSGTVPREVLRVLWSSPDHGQSGQGFF